MIQVTRLNREEYWLNPLLIETMEVTPDTLITLVTGKKLMVLESVEVVIERMNRFYGVFSPTTLPSHIISQSLSEGDLE